MTPEDKDKPSIAAVEAPDSFFPALVEMNGELEIIDIHEIPVNIPMTVKLTSPLTPARLLNAFKQWHGHTMDTYIRENR